MNKCRMITIDPSTSATGLAIFDNALYQDVIFLSLETKKTNMEDRFPEMANWIYKNIVELEPDIIYIEETVVTRNVSEQRFLTRLQGVVYAYCIEHDCEFNTIRPTEWRMYAGIKQGRKKRQELKAAALNMVHTKYGMKDLTEDEAEAILIGYAVIEKFERLEKRIK